MIYYLNQNKTLQQAIKNKIFWRSDTKTLTAEIDIDKVFLDLVLKTSHFICFKQIVSTVKLQYLKVLNKEKIISS